MREFKVGDKVRRTSEHNSHGVYNGGVYIVSAVRHGWLELEGVDSKHEYPFNSSYFELVEAEDKSKWHKHHDVIVAWAKGSKVQIFGAVHKEWMDCECPSFGVNRKYRIKPEKSEAEIELEKLQEKINELQQQADKLKEKM